MFVALQELGAGESAWVESSRLWHKAEGAELIQRVEAQFSFQQMEEDRHLPAPAAATPLLTSYRLAREIASA
ncbi:hypothetical protein [Devosia sp.]|jgi:hypothetical protein|uniref:hypothetical protein n=1 Tax=Devosia sp. TaxID=1871048 RepID=UPI0027363EE2|nr:hypothetical protein [Devosia sp.]MDP2782546.1 hypothetical protein [Devosia sp.]